MESKEVVIPEYMNDRVEQDEKARGKGNILSF